MELENVCMKMIANSGEGRSLAFEALRAAKAGEIEEAKNKLSEAEEVLTEAHKAQSDLLFKFCDGGDIQMNVLLVHAQDHFMTSLLAKDLISEIIDLCK